MKVKIFTGTHRAAVDQQVNDWIARSNVEVRRPVPRSKLSESWAGTPFQAKQRAAERLELQFRSGTTSRS